MLKQSSETPVKKQGQKQQVLDSIQPWALVLNRHTYRGCSKYPVTSDPSWGGQRSFL